MAGKTWLVMDGNNLAHRAFYALTEDLSHEGVSTAMLFGVFRDIAIMTQKFQTPHIAFCFDAGRPRRLEKLPTYKETREKNRKALDPDTALKYKAMRRQIRDLQCDILPGMGYANVFWEGGYEADDCIASFVYGLGARDDAIIVSSDKDLYQLLGTNVKIYRPTAKEVYTLQKFKEEWGLPPTKWAEVKAIAGCDTDDVPGIRGVGEKTAAKYLRNELKPTSKAAQSIADGMAKWKKNIPLVTLPYPGTPCFFPKQDRVSLKTWRVACTRFGMRSLIEDAPLFPQ